MATTTSTTTKHMSTTEQGHKTRKYLFSATKSATAALGRAHRLPDHSRFPTSAANFGHSFYLSLSLS